MATYDIPTNNGVKTVQADSKALALDSLKSAGETPQLLTPTGTNTAPVMTPQNLSSGSLIPVPTTPTSTTATDITAGADASVSNHDALTQKLEADQLAAQTADKKAKGDYQATVNKILGIENSRTSVENGLQVNEKSIVANDAFNALQASKRAQEVAIKNLETNNQGLSDVGLQQETNRINRQYAFEQADLSIALDVANRSYTSAQATADKKIQLQLEPLQTLIGFQEKLLSSADTKLSQAEQNKLQVLMDKNKRELDTQEQKAKDLEATNLTLLKSASEQGAPASVIQAITAAKTPEEKIAAAGQYSGDILDRRIKQAQLNNLNADIKKKNIEIAGQNPTVTNLDAATYKPALDIILGSAKFTKEQKADVIKSVNAGQDPFSVIKNQAKNIMGQTEATKLSSYEVARDTLSDIGTQLAEFYKKGGSTGIFTGNFESVTNKLGQVNNPDLVDLATQIAGNIQVYRNAISGTAYSVQEGKNIDSIFPGINKSESLNNAILSGRSRLFDSVIDATYRTALGKTYDDLKKVESQVNPTAGDLLNGAIPNSPTSTVTPYSPQFWDKVNSNLKL